MRLFRIVLPAAIFLAACGGPSNVQNTCAKDTDCDDSNACTTDTCSSGACVHGDVQKDDGNVCTDDHCDPATGVKHDAISVDDNDACTTDSCDPVGGISHVAVATDDGNACTTDSCDPETGVKHVAVNSDDGNACTTDACDPATGVSHTAVATDDGDACTTDACDPATGVSHTAVTTDDGDACTADACDPSTGVSHTPVAIDDMDACTTDACNPSTGVSHAAVATDDNNPCTYDACDPVIGVTHTAVNVNDNDVCTTDACDPSTGVTHTAVSVNDNNACTTDACDPTTGVSHTAVATDDGNACTTDACDPTTGVSHTPVNTNDNNACTTDACDPTTGVSHTAVATDDGNACTTDACDPTTGVTHTAVATDDGNACTTDACDPATGVSHTPVATDDGDQCTTDSCDQTGVHHDPIALDDNNACTTDSCNPFSGPVHTPKNTNDNNACTTDSCDPATGNVSHVDTTNDNNACTTDVCDPSTGVTHTPVATNDNNACTTDSCDPSTGVVTHVNTTDDNNACTTDTCDPSTGVTHTPVTTDDGVACTVDSCDPATGVSHTPNNNACEQDGFTCTAPVCNPTTGCSEVATPLLCDDSSSCTADSCVGAGGDPGSGCKHQANDSLCPALQACTSGGCGGAVTQAGHVIVTEFRSMGVEFIEVKNISSSAVDLHGFKVRNSANQIEVIRATSDRNNSANTPVMVAAGARAYGVVNPTGLIAGTPDFFIGDPGSSFNLADTGDFIQLFAQDGSTEDVVDFRTFVSDPNVSPAANAFVGFNGRSTQLDSRAAESAAANDSAANWCVTFYPAAPAPRVRVPDTAGAANGSCGAVVINESLFDAPGADDGNTFVELAGPGGAQVGGMILTDVEGSTSGSSGQRNNPDVVIPAGIRIPADGIIVIADGLNDAGTTFNGTLVPNVGPADVTVRSIDFENSGGDSTQLWSGGTSPTLLDVLGQDLTDAGFPVSPDVVSGRSYHGVTYETMTAWTPPVPTNGNSAASLARNTLSADTDNNRADFHADPSPTPGVENDLVAVSITSITPDDAIADGGTTAGVTLTGTDFVASATNPFGDTVLFGNVPATSCVAPAPTKLVCTAPNNANIGRVDVTVKSPTSVGVPDAVRASGFTYTGVLNGSSNPQQADFCNLQFPVPSFSVDAGTPTPLIYGQLYEAGATESAGPAIGWTAEVGYGPTTANPTTQQGWQFFPASYNVQSNNNDEYQASFTAPAAGTYSYTYRFSVDNGLNYTYCDMDGAGSNAGLSFSTTQLGTMTVNP